MKFCNASDPVRRVTGFAVLAALLLTTGRGMAQGTVYFSNRAAEIGLNQPVFEANGVILASGTEFRARLLAGPVPEALFPVGDFAGFSPYLSEDQRGYFGPVVLTLDNVAPGQLAYARVQVWSTILGPTYEIVEAKGGRRGTSDLFSFTAGGDTRGDTVPPTLPAYLAGFRSFAVAGFDPPTPEPGVVSLFALGSLVLLRRRVS